MLQSNAMLRKRLVNLLTILCLAGGLLIAARPPMQADSSALRQQVESTKIYLPLVALNYPSPPPVFSVEIRSGKVSATVAKADDARVWWVRYNGLLWSDVESVQGNRDWSQIADEELELQKLAERGLTPMVIVRGTPSWAQKVPGVYCGPIKEDRLDDFASFVGELVTRYSSAPYNVKYWELWNEPDVAPEWVKPTSAYGCWGDENDADYGGQYYAKMLKRVYPAIKQADPEAQVVLGGLLLWCDPDDPNPEPGTNGCLPARFLEGILTNGGGHFLDVVAYHAYPYWAPGSTQQDWDLAQLHWDHRGGTLLGKLDFIRELLRQYKITKPIIMNEGGLMCYSGDPSDPDCLSNALLSAQANYAVRLYARTWANSLLGATWYTLDGPGWRQGGLLDANQNPRPAYHTFKFMAQLLEGAAYSRSLSAGTLEGYAFYNKETSLEYRVYWTNNESTTATLSLPANSTVYDKSGQNITPPGGTILVGFEPIFIQVALP